MTIALGCIADDFTGATDLAGLLARSGLGVSLRIGVPEIGPHNAETATFEVIALKCRTSPVEEAVAAARSALLWLRAAGAERFFWKYCSTFDSTAEGNIGPVAEALMTELNADRTLYCPAFPENGRRVFMGNLFVQDRPLGESSMRDHPLTPMTDSNLMRLLAPQISGDVALIDHPTVARGAHDIRAAVAASKAPHIVVDAIADGDLREIAEACHDLPLLTGGSALAMPLPDIYRRNGRVGADSPAPVRPEIAGGSLVLSGSCSAMTRKQVRTYLETAQGYRLDPLVLAQEGPGAARDWLARQHPDAPKIIYATADPVPVREAQEKLGTEKAGAIVEAALADLAEDALKHGVSRFVVAGGETSGAVTKSLGITRMEIGEEIAPGVPWTYSKRNGRQIALALKSGNFGEEDFFSRALAML